VLKVYLSGEIHTDWREQITQGAKGLDVSFNSPVTRAMPLLWANH